MIEWFKEYWYLAVIFVVVCIIAAVIFYFAGKSYSSYRAAYRNQEAEIKRLTELKGRFVPLTQSAVENSDSAETLEGVALSYQLFLQKQEDMEKEFSLMSEPQRYAYILDVFVQDKSLDEFFRQNGNILKKEITSAFELIGMKDFADKIENIRKMFDDEDDVTSLDQSQIDALQKYADDNDIYTEVKLRSAEYIKNNSQLFVK